MTRRDALYTVLLGLLVPGGAQLHQGRPLPAAVIAGCAVAIALRASAHDQAAAVSVVVLLGIAEALLWNREDRT